MKIVSIQPVGSYLFALDSAGGIWRAHATAPVPTLKWVKVNGPDLPAATRRKKSAS